MRIGVPRSLRQATRRVVGRPVRPVITLDELESEGACEWQLRAFRQAFGESVEVTEKLAVAHCEIFNVWWAARHLLRDGVAYDREREVICRELGVGKANHGIDQGSCVECTLEARANAIAFARRLIAERGEGAVR